MSCEDTFMVSWVRIPCVLLIDFYFLNTFLIPCVLIDCSKFIFLNFRAFLQFWCFYFFNYYSYFIFNYGFPVRTVGYIGNASVWSAILIFVTRVRNYLLTLLCVLKLFFQYTYVCRYWNLSLFSHYIFLYFIWRFCSFCDFY